MFPGESTKILKPSSLPAPLNVVNAAIVPSGAYFKMYASPFVVAGNVYPEDIGVLFRPMLFMAMGPEE